DGREWFRAHAAWVRKAVEVCATAEEGARGRTQSWCELERYRSHGAIVEAEHQRIVGMLREAATRQRIGDRGFARAPIAAERQHSLTPRHCAGVHRLPAERLQEQRDHAAPVEILDRLAGCTGSGEHADRVPV